MNGDEFEHKWKRTSRLKIIVFNGGTIFATGKTNVEVSETNAFGNVRTYTQINFYKDVSGVVVETGTCRLSAIKEVL